MFDGNIKNILFCHIFFAFVHASGVKVNMQDQTTSRANTLFDDADDLQRQLENEARDKMKFGRPKTVWVFHLPAQFPGLSTDTLRSRDSTLLKRRVTYVGSEYCSPSSVVDERQWDYKDQSKWGKLYPDCTGKSQSPVDLPNDGLVKTKGARQMLFGNYDVLPQRMIFINDGKSIKYTGVWHESMRPFIYGGAAHSRRYLFDSISLHWPSEHTIAGLQYPFESQALYVSAEYPSLDEALHATDDKMAILGVANLYKFSNHTHKGLRELLKAVLSGGYGSKPVSQHPLSYFNPPFKEYACYHGSVTTPPCIESVLWLVRARAMPVTREVVDAVQDMYINGEKHQFLFRQTQTLNDRKIFFFN